MCHFRPPRAAFSTVSARPTAPGRAPRGASSLTHPHAPPHTHPAHNNPPTEFNTISTLSDELNVFFSTAFHYAVPSPPADPILHLIGNDLTTGELVYDAVVANPFCEILWLPGAR